MFGLAFSNTVTYASTCIEILKLKSIGGGQITSLKISNKTNGMRSYKWINYEGNQEKYGIIPSGGSVVIKTYVGHPWIFSDKNNNCAEGILASVSNDSLTLTVASKGDAEKSKFVKTSEYEVMDIEGFQVLFSPKVIVKKKQKAKVIAEFEKQFSKIKSTLSEGKVKELQTTKFWVELNYDPNAGAFFSPSISWLLEDGDNPEKEFGITIASAKNFVDWSKLNQPWMMLHELSHAYHEANRAKIDMKLNAAYNAAIEGKSYDKVKYNLGGKKRAYALNTPEEYFAELSEAYFGENDYFPFNRIDLAKHDPQGLELMKEAWGE